MPSRSLVSTRVDAGLIGHCKGMKPNAVTQQTQPRLSQTGSFHTKCHRQSALHRQFRIASVLFFEENLGWRCPCQTKSRLHGMASAACTIDGVAYVKTCPVISSWQTASAAFLASQRTLHTSIRLIENSTSKWGRVPGTSYHT